MPSPPAEVLAHDAVQRCAVVVEQKGDDPAECRERVVAGCETYRALAGRVPHLWLAAVVSGAAGDIGPDTLHAWCAPFGIEPLVHNESHHTRDKAESIAAMVREHEVARVIQVTSLYHSLRAYLDASHRLQPSPGHRKYLAHRHSEARRIAAYAEAGKGHLVTDVPLKEILDSYPA